MIALLRSILTSLLAKLGSTKRSRPDTYVAGRRSGSTSHMPLHIVNGSGTSLGWQSADVVDNGRSRRAQTSRDHACDGEEIGGEIRDHRGRVSFVGGGPGDPGLLTLKGKRYLEHADVIIYDYLVNERLLIHCRPEAERISVGKPGTAARLSQQEINILLIARARAGKAVVRLKGGDPFVFSRGAEEAEALVEAGVSFEIVPGVTSAIAVPSYAGIPVTHRQLASTVTFVTGHEDPTKEVSGIDWKAVAGMATVVILMGVSRLSQIVARLLEAGRPPETPVAVVEWGTLPQQRTLTGTLGDIVKHASEVRSPAVIVVGEVVRLRDRLQWFEEVSWLGFGAVERQQRATAVKLSDA